jgi:hypothetical protein
MKDGNDPKRGANESFESTPKLKIEKGIKEGGKKLSSWYN